MAQYLQRTLSDNDDGYAAGGWIYLSSSFGYGRAFAGNENYGAVRFNSVNIPQGAIINSAYLRLTDSQNQGARTVKVWIHGIDEDDTADLSSDPDGRAKTSARVGWDFNSVSQVTNTVRTSPDLATVIQEIIDRAGWVSGNDLALISDDNGTGNDNILRWISYAGDSTKAPQLEINWSSATSTSTTTTTSTSTSTSTTTTSTTTTTLPPEKDFYGIKVLRPNVPENTLLPKNFFLNSHYKMLKIHKQGSFRSTYVRNVGLSLNVAFPGLNYRPMVLVYMQRMQHDGNLDPTYHLLEWSYWGATKVGYQRVKVYNDKFVIDYSDMLVDDLAINFQVLGYYYVFREEVTA